MGIEKEVAAFVELIGKDVSESARPRKRERNRAAFVTLRPYIEGALASGYAMKTIWGKLRDQK
ncbi:TraK family protein, partial [Klebsiella pneumoniae]|nr:TraK family protein [Klebsiella pneumoniae]